MSVDVKYFTVCDHIVNGKVYRPDMCIKCLGKNYYLDLSFDKKGFAVTTNGAIKLQQEMLKVLLDEKYSDLFHPNWGSEIHTLIGHKKVAITKSRLEMMVRRAIEYLKALQENEAKSNTAITDDEIVGKIEWIALEPISVTGWNVYVSMSNRVNEIYSQTIEF